MSHGLDEAEPASAAVSKTDTAGPAGVLLAYVNHWVVILASIALVIAACVLTYSVITRYFLHLSTDWQDEMSVFLIVGAVFMSAAAVQARRGHVAIEAIVGLLSPRAKSRWQIAVDVATFIFCAYFSWKSVLLLHEAIVEGFRTSSTWQPPLRVPCFAHDRRHDPAELAGPAADCRAVAPPECDMSVLAIGLLYGAATLLVMFSGMPIAFALGAVATIFMVMFMPSSSVDTITQNVYEEMASITLLSIPLFITKGSAIGRSRAGQDLYGALHAWLHKFPGGLGIANVFACALFAAMAGSSPATCLRSVQPAFRKCAATAIPAVSPPA